jgi:hypothetical protein
MMRNGVKGHSDPIGRRWFMANGKVCRAVTILAPITLSWHNRRLTGA